MSNAQLEQLLSSQAGIALCWLGNLSWLIHAGGQLIATDLDLDREGRIQPSPVPAKEIAPGLNVHLITHGHEDHFSSPTCAILAERSSCTFVVPANCVEKAYGNRYWTKGYPDELRARLPRRMQERFHKLEQGQVYVMG